MGREMNRYKYRSQQRYKRLMFLRTLYLFTTEYYGGQWSRGYRLLCVTRKRIEHLNRMLAIPGSGFRWMDNQDLLTHIRLSETYRKLVENHARKM